MRTRTRALIAAAAAVAASGAIATAAGANPAPPTNGGSHLGGGQSGQCTGPLEDRPASCGN